MAQAAYGKVPARDLAPRAEFAEPPRMAETRHDHRPPRCEGAAVQPHLSRAVLCRRPRRARRKALETLAQILGGDQTAMLYRMLVEEKKLATDAGASPMTAMPAMPANSRVYAVPRPGVSLETLEKAVDQVMARQRRWPCRATGPRARQDRSWSPRVTYRRDSQFAMAIGLWPGADDRADGGRCECMARPHPRRERAKPCARRPQALIKTRGGDAPI